jgi:hypothetical protein
MPLRKSRKSKTLTGSDRTWLATSSASSLDMMVFNCNDLIRGRSFPIELS